MNTILNLSLSDFWRTPKAGCKANSRERTLTIRNMPDSWIGMPKAERADLPSKGWPAGVEKALALLQDTGIAPGQSRLARRWDWEDGETLDYARLLDGMAPWQRFKRTAGGTGGRIVTLAVMCGMAARFDPETMAWRAYAAVRAADDLESAGYRVEILAVFQVVNLARSGPDQNLEVRVTVKRAEDPLDLSQLAAVLSPAAFRDTFFRWIESMPYAVKSSYGTPPQYAQPLEPLDCLFLSRHVTDQASAQAFLSQIDEKVQAA